MPCAAHFMQQALLVGRQVLPGCRPKPLVGWVRVPGQQIVRQGFSPPPGEHHAEAMVLAQWPLSPVPFTATGDLRAYWLEDAD